MYINDVYIVYYVIALLLGLIVGELVGWLNDRFNDKYYHIREWYFIEVDKIDGLDYTDVYADIIVTNNIN